MYIDVPHCQIIASFRKYSNSEQCLVLLLGLIVLNYNSYTLAKTDVQKPTHMLTFKTPILAIISLSFMT